MVACVKFPREGLEISMILFSSHFLKFMPDRHHNRIVTANPKSLPSKSQLFKQTLGSSESLS